MPKFFLTPSFILLVASTCLYLASLPCNSFSLSPDSEFIPGYLLLLTGGFGIFSLNPTNLVWLANPLLFIAWGANIFRLSWLSVVVSGLALAVGLYFLFCTKVSASMTSWDDFSQITKLHVGYWLWIASMGCAFLSSVLGVAIKRQNHAALKEVASN
jgi:hypothetical protein